jgi:histidinol-phosphate aminotransferase
LSSFARPHLRRLTPYSAGKPIEELERELGIRDVVKLASNENPIGPSPRALDAMRAALAELHRYPDTDMFALRARVAALHGVGGDELSFGNGSNHVIDLICRTFAGPEDHAVIGSPSFVCYRLFLAAADVATTEVPLDHGLFWNPDRMLAALRPNTRLLFLDNPNNPTSTHLGREGLTHLLSGLPDTVIPVIDEAYVQFVDAADYTSAIELRSLSPNLIVLRTFSKAYGLAAARVGYAVGPNSLIADLERVRTAFNVNGVALAGALAALDDRAHLDRVVELNRGERVRLSTALAELGLSVAPSQTNFVLVQLPTEAEPIYEALLRNGVITRTLGGLPRQLRISIGLPAENAKLLHALREVLR